MRTPTVHRRLWYTAALLLAAPAAAVCAQAPRPLASYATVRVWLRPGAHPQLAQLVAGTLVPRGDSLRLAVLVHGGAGETLVPLASIDSVQVRRVTDRSGRGAVIGAVVGAAVGAAAAYDDSPTCNGICVLDPGVVAAFGGVVGALGGTLAGAVVGSLFETEHWDTVRPPIEVSIAPGADGRLWLGARIATR